MVFSTNQVRQLYVLGGEYQAPASDLTNLGDLSFVTDSNDPSVAYFQHIGHGGLVRSDLIKKENILYAKSTNASAMQRTLKRYKVVLDSDVNNGQPIVGQDYLLRVNIRQFVTIGDDSTYQKYGIVHAHSGMSTAEFYTKMAVSLFQNFSREATPLVKIYLEGGSTNPIDELRTVDGEKVPYAQGLPLTVNNAAGIIIEEAEQEWTLGIKELTPVYFDVQPTTVTLNGEDVIWGSVIKNYTSGELPAVVIDNGKLIADLEYFCMGERGDQYRNVGWPNSIPTKYMVNADDPYHVLDIHYAYVGPNEGPQKSEKDITIVCASKTELNKVISAFNTFSGLQVASIV